jgi:hypothetical protein
MTVTNQTNKTRQHGNGITDTFNFTFPIFEESNLEVYKIDTSVTPEVATLQTITTDYTVDISQTSEGGSVTFVVTPTSDEDVFIKRVMDFKQRVDIETNSNFPENDMEKGLDKSRMLDIQLQENDDRTLKINEFYDGSATFEIPNPEASKVIGWASDGVTMANYSGSDLDTILTTSYGKTLVQSAGAEGARDILELGTTDDVQFNDITCSQITATTYVGIPKISGDMVQLVNETVTSVGSGTTIVPTDDTIPQKTEGDEYITKSITPTKATNKLKIEVNLGCLSPSANVQVTVALFQDDNADAIAVGTQVIRAGEAGAISLLHYMTAGTTSPTTFKIRVGPSATATLTVNGVAGSRLYGGKSSSSLTITEIEV